MRFLRSFLAGNTIPKVVPKPPEPPCEPTSTTLEVVPKPPELGFGGFGTSGTLVYADESPSSPSLPKNTGKSETGITVADVLREFPGLPVVAVDKLLSCQHCEVPSVPAWRRGGKIVERVWPDGRREWACHFCGRSRTVDEGEPRQLRLIQGGKR